MLRKIIEQLHSKVKSACPEDTELSVKKLPLGKARVLYLLIFRYNKKASDIDEWAINDVYKLFHNIYPIFEKENIAGKIRFLFCNENNFVLYTPLDTTTLNRFDGLIYRECYGYDHYVHLIGKTYNIDKLIDYLIAQRKNF